MGKERGQLKGSVKTNQGPVQSTYKQKPNHPVHYPPLPYCPKDEEDRFRYLFQTTKQK
jgi:hypothetical protein